MTSYIPPSCSTTAQRSRSAGSADASRVTTAHALRRPSGASNFLLSMQHRRIRPTRRPNQTRRRATLRRCNRSIRRWWAGRRGPAGVEFCRHRRLRTRRRIGRFRFRSYRRRLYASFGRLRRPYRRRCIDEVIIIRAAVMRAARQRLRGACVVSTSTTKTKTTSMISGADRLRTHFRRSSRRRRRKRLRPMTIMSTAACDGSSSVVALDRRRTAALTSSVCWRLVSTSRRHPAEVCVVRMTENCRPSTGYKTAL